MAGTARCAFRGSEPDWHFRSAMSLPLKTKIGTAKVFRPKRAKDFANPIDFRRPYGRGDVLTLMSVLVSVLVEGAGDSFMMVVLLSFFSAGGFVTVVSFCSQPASRAAPIKRQMYFFM